MVTEPSGFRVVVPVNETPEKAAALTGMAMLTVPSPGNVFVMGTGSVITKLFPEIVAAIVPLTDCDKPKVEIVPEYDPV